jgi:hypothetical protein
MRFVHVGGTCFAAVMALGIVGFAQEPAQPRNPAPAPAPAPAAPAPQQQQERSGPADQSITVVGCVQSEADYRRAQDAGKGGVAGTGIGAGNEFVLINASMATGAAGAGPNAPGANEKPTGTAGSSPSAFELTGPNEGQLASHVGKRVEIVGTVKPAEIGASGPTGGPTAGAPPRGVDVTSEDLKLREIEVKSVRETSGACPASK